MQAVNEFSCNVLNKLYELAKKNEDHFKLNNDHSFIPLSIEIIGENRLSICHYRELNGDLMRDPEMIFYKSHDDEKWYPIYYRNDWIGKEEFSCHLNEKMLVVDNVPQQLSQASFADTWCRNISIQQSI
jgi:hypothetical protein